LCMTLVAKKKSESSAVEQSISPTAKVLETQADEDFFFSFPF